MKRTARPDTIVITILLIFSIFTVISFADDGKWIQDKPARLVSFKVHSEIKCSVCGKIFITEHESVRESDLSGTYSSDDAGAHYYWGFGKTGYSDYDCRGIYRCISYTHCYVEVLINGKFDHRVDCTQEQANHIKAHGIDNKGNSADLIFIDSYEYGEIYKPAEGHYVYEYADNELNDERVKISKSAFTYNKKNQRPTVEVVINGKKLSAKTDYTVTYPKKSKSVGTYKIIVKGKGKYKGTVTKTYQIKQGKLKLGKPTVKKIKKGNKTQIYTKPSGNYEATTYYFRIANDKNCTNFLVGKTKTKLTKKKIAVYGKLTKGKTYYLQVCAAKGKYSTEWSSPVAIKGK